MKTPQKKKKSASTGIKAQQETVTSTSKFKDDRLETVTQRKLQSLANDHTQASEAAQLQSTANNSVSQHEVLQKKKNDTGLPDKLKAGVEQLSGVALDDVKVHYNSAKPAQLQAHAYAQGSNIHIAPGQEKHLPHETWHVVQQKQGRVKPTVQLKNNVQLNNDKGLEQEADVMGNLAMQLQLKPLVGEQAYKREDSAEPLLVLQRVENGEVMQLEIGKWLKAGWMEGQPIMHGLGMLGSAASFAFDHTVGHAVSASIHGVGSFMAISKLVYDLYHNEGNEASKKKIARDIVNVLTGLGLTTGDIVAMFHPLVGIIISSASSAARAPYPFKDALTEPEKEGSNKKAITMSNAAMNLLLSPLIMFGSKYASPYISLLQILTTVTNFLQGWYSTKEAKEEGTYDKQKPRSGYTSIA